MTQSLSNSRVTTVYLIFYTKRYLLQFLCSQFQLFRWHWPKAMVNSFTASLHSPNGRKFVCRWGCASDCWIFPLVTWAQNASELTQNALHTLKRKGRLGGCPGRHWICWRQASTPPVTTMAVRFSRCRVLDPSSHKWHNVSDKYPMMHHYAPFCNRNVHMCAHFC